MYQYQSSHQKHCQDVELSHSSFHWWYICIVKFNCFTTCCWENSYIVILCTLLTSSFHLKSNSSLYPVNSLFLGLVAPWQSVKSFLSQGFIKQGFIPDSGFGLVRINVVPEGAAVHGPPLQPRGSSWLECVRGIMGSYILRHSHRRTENPSVPQLEGKVWGDHWQGSQSLRFCEIRLFPLLWIYTPVSAHQHKNRDSTHPVKSNPPYTTTMHTLQCTQAQIRANTCIYILASAQCCGWLVCILTPCSRNSPSYPETHCFT